MAATQEGEFWQGVYVFLGLFSSPAHPAFTEGLFFFGGVASHCGLLPNPRLTQSCDPPPDPFLRKKTIMM